MKMRRESEPLDDTDSTGKPMTGTVTADQSSCPPFLAGWRPYLLIAAAGALLFGQCAFFDFTLCDDYRDIVEKREYNESLSRIPGTFSESFGSLYRPILRISWIVDASMGGTDPFVYHVTNVIYHLAASCLVFAALVVLRQGRPLAFFLALVFTLHPIVVQAVAWIPGRNDSNLAIFVLLSLLFLVRARRGGSWLLAAAHFLFFALALFTKESAAVFPLLGLFLLWLDEREKFFSKSTAILVAGWVVIGAGWLLARGAAVSTTHDPDVVGLAPLLENALTLPALLGKMIVPWKLSGVATFDWISIGAGFILAAVVAVLSFRLDRTDLRLVAFGALWLLLFQAPALFYRLPHADDHYDYLEHRAYVPLFGLLVIASRLLARFRFSFNSKAAKVWAAILLALLAVRAFAYSTTFREREIFWEKAIASDPTRATFHAVQGELYCSRNELGKAEKYLLKALEVSVLEDPDNYANLGVIYRKMNRHAESLKYFEKAAAIDPKSSRFRCSLGRALDLCGQSDEAERELKKAVELDPRNKDAYLFLVGLYSARKENEKASRACSEVLRIDPENPVACYIMGRLLAERGEHEKAAKMWKKAIAIEPGYLASYPALINWLLERDRLDEARRYTMEYLNRGGSIPAEALRAMGL